MINKKGQLAIQDIFSYLAYITVFFFVILYLGLIQSCDRFSPITSSIEIEQGAPLELRTEQQLNAYLNTDVLDMVKLIERINSMEGKGELLKGLDKDGTIIFLQTHPEVIANKNYATFIEALYAYRDLDEYESEGITYRFSKQDVFTVVTRALFYQHVYPKSEMLKHPEFEEVYFVPYLGVKFDALEAFNSRKGDLAVKEIEEMRRTSVAQEAYRFIPAKGQVLTVKLIGFANVGDEERQLPLP